MHQNIAVDCEQMVRDGTRLVATVEHYKNSIQVH